MTRHLGTDPARRSGRRAVLWLAAAGAMAAACGEQPSATTGVHLVGTFGATGIGPGRFGFPRAIDCDDRAVWVIDKSARVQRIDPKTGEVLATWTMPQYRLGKPTGVTIAPGGGPDGADAVYVPDTHYQRVAVYAIPESGMQGAEPPLIAQFGGYGTGPGQFIYPTDVAVLAAAGRAVERVYVSEYGGNDRVSVFDGSHRFLFSFGEFGTPGAALFAAGDGASAEEPVVPDAGKIVFNRPQSLALDAARRQLIVADACNHRLGVFDLDGKPIRWIGSRETAGRGPGQFNYPYGLALCDDGSVLVSEFGNHRVQRVDPETGESLGLYLSMGRGEGQVLTPWGVAVSRRDRGIAYVLDSGNNRVIAFELPAARRLAMSRGTGGSEGAR